MELHETSLRTFLKEVEHNITGVYALVSMVLGLITFLPMADSVRAIFLLLSIACLGYGWYIFFLSKKELKKEYPLYSDHSFFSSKPFVGLATVIFFGVVLFPLY